MPVLDQMGLMELATVLKNVKLEVVELLEIVLEVTESVVLVSNLIWKKSHLC